MQEPNYTKRQGVVQVQLIVHASAVVAAASPIVAVAVEAAAQEQE
jgi:hypothetical protein